METDKTVPSGRLSLRCRSGKTSRQRDKEVLTQLLRARYEAVNDTATDCAAVSTVHA